MKKFKNLEQYLKISLVVLIVIFSLIFYFRINLGEVYCIENQLHNFRICTNNKTEFLNLLKIYGINDFYDFGIYEIEEKLNKTKVSLSNEKNASLN